MRRTKKAHKLADHRVVDALHDPLALRETRVKLLLWSYKDALEAERGTGENIGHQKPGSHAHLRGSLWREGSYKELEQVLDALRAFRRSQSHHVWERYISCGKARNHKAELGLKWVLTEMPRVVFVPDSVSQGAGYEPHEAKLYTRRRSRA